MPAKPAWPPRSAPRLFVPPDLFAGAEISISGNQAHYLSRVMRVAEGGAAVLCDNATGEWASSVVSVAKREVILRCEELLRPREAVPDFRLYAALLKKPAFDLVLEKATELGVAEIRPMRTRRCVADSLNLERATTIVTEAAEQCARTALPVVTEPETLDSVLRDWPADRLLYFADEQGGATAAACFAAGIDSASSPAALLIGPEGGFDDAERAAIRSLPQARPISLGPRILRGETAAIAAMAVWMAVAGDWGN